MSTPPDSPRDSPASTPPSTPDDTPPGTPQAGQHEPGHVFFGEPPGAQEAPQGNGYAHSPHAGFAELEMPSPYPLRCLPE